MEYLAIVSWDFTNQDTNAGQRLQNAIAQLDGWEYQSTSSLVYQADSINGVLEALDLLGRYVPKVGDLTMLSIQVKRITYDATEPPNRRSHNSALDNVLKLPPAAAHYGGWSPGKDD